MSDNSDEELARRFRDGDEAAFVELRARYRKAIRGFIRSRVAIASLHDDIEAETWTEIWRHHASYDEGKGSFFGFARYWAGICTRRAYGKRTPEGRWTRRTQPLDERVTCPEDPGVDPEALMLQSEAAALRAARFGWLLAGLLSGASPPHQVLASVRMWLLQETPAEIVAEQSLVPLAKLADCSQSEFAKVSDLPAWRIADAFAPFQRSLSLPFDKVVREPKTLEAHPQLAGRIVGQTMLEDYYPGLPVEERRDRISKWTFAVKRRLITQAAQEAKARRRQP